jgi:triacylglycerol lipase
MVIPRLRSPVVLVHGLFGFDRIQAGNWVLADYFPGIPDALRAAGNRVLVARLSPTGGVAQRARQLQELIDRESPHEPVHLIAHSMGGLDSRYLVSRLGMADRVLSLTTLGTPHRGSPFADWALRHFGHFLAPAFDFLGVPRKAFEDLTVARCRRFSEETPDAPGVRYFSVAGRVRPDWLSPQWHLPASILEKAEGPNDGVVSVESARHGEGCEVWDDDHLGLVNFRHPLQKVFRACPDRAAHYAGLVRRLADEGF